MGYAVFERQEEKVQVLLDANADPTQRDAYVLNLAVLTGNLEVIRLIAARSRVEDLRAEAQKATEARFAEIREVLLDFAENSKE